MPIAFYVKHLPHHQKPNSAAAFVAPTETETIGGQLEKPNTYDNCSVLLKNSNPSCNIYPSFPYKSQILRSTLDLALCSPERSMVFLDSVQKPAAKQCLPEIYWKYQYFQRTCSTIEAAILMLGALILMSYVHLSQNTDIGTLRLPYNQSVKVPQLENTIF